MALASSSPESEGKVRGAEIVEQSARAPIYEVQLCVECLVNASPD